VAQQQRLQGPTMIAPRMQSSPWIVLLVLTLGFFMILLDTTIVNIAIPDLEKGLSATFDQILWTLNAYILVYAVLLITAGRLGDIFGPKRLFLAGLVIFTLSSAACGFAQSPAELIAFRVVQGLGGAILTPQTLSVITTIFPPERRGAAFGIWGAVGGLAAVIGPTLGGLLVTTASWRAIFYINVPIGVIAVIAAILLMPEIKSDARHKLDFPGVGLASTGLFLGVFALIEAQRFNWGPITNFGSFSVGPMRWAVISIYSLLLYSGAVLIAFVFLETRVEEPILPISLFRDRNFTVANGVSAGVNYGMLSVFLPTTIFLQSVLGFTAVHAGLTYIPMSAMAFLMAPFAGRLSDRINGKYILMFGTACFALGIGWLVHSLSLSDSSWSLALPMGLAGLGMGCTFPPMVALAMRDVNPAMAGSASGFLNTIRQVGQAMGGAIGGAILGNAVAGQIKIQAHVLAYQVPLTFRAGFIAAFDALSQKPQSFGPGQSTALHIPPKVPPAVRHHLAAVGKSVFSHAFLNGMRPSMIAAVGALAVTVVVAAVMRPGLTAAQSARSRVTTPVEAAN
jgi:EmrB/QacA subfamily drug resistance transporter